MAEASGIARVSSNLRKFRQEQFTVWRCSNCQSLHSKEDVDLGYYYAHYYLGNHQLDYFSRCSYRSRLQKLMRQGFCLEHSLLDYGCGPGLFVTYLREKGHADVAGYDPYVPDMADPRRLERQYDVVTAFDVIEHDADPQQFLQRLLSFVKPGGLLVIGTPNAETIDLQKPQTVELHQPYHRHILSQRILEALGRQLGLQVLEVQNRYYMDTLFPAVNTRFIWEYVYAHGGVLDATMEPAQVGRVLTSPRLLFFAVAGYFFPPRQSMLVFFRKPMVSQ